MVRLARSVMMGARFLRLHFIPFKSGLGSSAWLLHGLARSLKPEVCVEIGSARGMSACFVGMALALNGKGKLYAIDPHSPTEWNDLGSVNSYEIMVKNVRSLALSRYVEIVRKTSVEAVQSWNRKIDLLFIDGDHSYEGIKLDWELFSPYVAPFGAVVFHDTAWDIDPSRWKGIRREDMGVPRFVDTLRQAGYPVITINNDFGVSVVQPHVGGYPLQLEGAGTDAQT
jgi:predicted O-methyltransferase YrrM